MDIEDNLEEIRGSLRILEDNTRLGAPPVLDELESINKYLERTNDKLDKMIELLQQIASPKIG